MTDRVRAVFESRRVWYGLAVFQLANAIAAVFVGDYGLACWAGFWFLFNAALAPSRPRP